MSVFKIYTNKTFYISLFIFLLAAILRFYKLGELPTAFAADEAALGYNGWSILTTGRDEWGNLFPLVLRSFDDWKPALYSYFTIPGILFDSLNEVTSRLPAAFCGSLLPVFMFLITYKLSKRLWLSILSALMIVISPWHIEISRTAIEAGVALTLFMISLYLLVGFRSIKIHLLSVFFLLLTLFTYHTARLIAPLILVVAIIFGVAKTPKSVLYTIIVVWIVGIGLSLTSSSSRFTQISIFKDQGSFLKREEAIREDGGPISVPLIKTRIYHNKPLSYLNSFADSYLINTSLSYLFFGGAQPPRVTIPDTGQFLLIYLPFFLVGLGISVRKFSKYDKWLLFWLVIAPLPAALTYAELPHTYRTLYLLPPIAYLIALGIYSCGLFLFKYSKYLFYAYVVVGSLISIFFFAKAWHQYSVHQQLHQPWFRQYGYHELINYLNSIETEKITITNREGEPYIFVLFYNKILPKDFQAWPAKRLAHKSIESGVTNWEMFNYTFDENPCPIDVYDTNAKNIYVVLPNCEIPPGFELIKTINFLDGRPEFLVLKPSVNAKDIDYQ